MVMEFGGGFDLYSQEFVRLCVSRGRACCQPSEDWRLSQGGKKGLGRSVSVGAGSYLTSVPLALGG